MSNSFYSCLKRMSLVRNIVYYLSVYCNKNNNNNDNNR